ncbi:hypothetical protein [Pseudoxanthomonas mexicana]|uniref:hypothetical protein n=1 Tax=Pseudoxanthomonas mexicana TaxID=128785 RepID=UPI0022F38D2F|nr:hypothetical protein [Pseudoxanthomonas mexicana]WBX92501.1 hypothetical protein PE064_12355 [Pseudoxanthomonas mexicana]
MSLFRTECARATMVCEVEQILEDGEWAVMDWRDPLGLRGCGFFQYATAASCSSAAISTRSASSASKGWRCRIVIWVERWRAAA